MKELIKHRKAMNLTQDQLGEKLGVSKMQIYRYENDYIQPSIDVLKRMADLFGVSVDSLIEHQSEIVHTRDLSDKQIELLKESLTLNPSELDKVLSFIKGIKS